MKIALVVMGVSGSGKTTVASLLAQRTGWPVAEADDFHSAANLNKMASGTPLNDEDRAHWLEALRAWIDAAPADVVLTCSALKRSYRDELRKANARVRFLHLQGGRDVIEARLRTRTNHFMPSALLDSQVADLQPLEPDEDGVSVTVEGSPSEVTDRAMNALGLACS